MINVYTKKHQGKKNGTVGKLGDRVLVAVLGQKKKGIIVGMKQKQRHAIPRYYPVLYCTVLYCTILYCTVLYCTPSPGTTATISSSSRTTATPPATGEIDIESVGKLCLD